MKDEVIGIIGGGVLAALTSVYASPDSLGGRTFDHFVGTFKQLTQEYNICLGKEFSECAAFASYPECVTLSFNTMGGNVRSLFDQYRYSSAVATRIDCLNFK